LLLFIGPVFTREAVTAPRRTKFYLTRGAYVTVLWILMCTAWLVLAGTQLVRNIGDLARFGSHVFAILAPLQLAVLTFFAALSAASAVALEKDRRTLELLLLTNLTNSELVLGKLLASIVNVVTMLAAALPLFVLLVLFGGVSVEQIVRTFAVTLFSILGAASLGSLVALWREKTFQTLTLTVLVLVLWLAGAEIVRAGVLGSEPLGIKADTWGAAISPLHAVDAAASPFAEADPALGPIGTPVNLFLAIALGLTLLLNVFAVAMVRVWNPSREARQPVEETAPESIWGIEHEMAAAERKTPAATAAAAISAETGHRTIGDLAATASQRRLSAVKRAKPVGKLVTREVWDNPIVWREIRTWAYGRRVLMIRLAYLVLLALAAAALVYFVNSPTGLTRGSAALALVPLFVVSLLLVNAQAVTSLTSERDVKALDLLLVTDVTPNEFVYGKLGGVFYNTKEMVLLPMILCGYLWYAREISLENLAYLLGGYLVLNVFVAMLGVHAGMTYGNSRTAIGTSLGTVFFLFIGVATCIRMMIAFSGSFQFQLLPFAALIGGGGVGMYVALGSRNPSAAIGIASFACPFFTFYAITSSLIEPPQTLGVFLTLAAAYGFTTAAMLIPAVYEFDVATGRTTGGVEE
jgi:ABC-type Na+ efflux pump permease subunit